MDTSLQEFYGLLLARHAVRVLMHEAALSADRDPDRLSFIHVMRGVERTLPRFVALQSGLLSEQYWALSRLLAAINWSGPHNGSCVPVPAPGVTPPTAAGPARPAASPRRS